MEVPRHWRLKKQRYALIGATCLQCNTPHFPPRDVCPNCGSGIHVSAQYPDQQETMAVVERAQMVS